MGSLKYARLLVLVFLAAGCVCSQTPSRRTQEAKTKKDNPELAALTQQILDLASSVPPELAAYAQLRVVEAHGVTQPDQIRRLIESSYRLAGQSPYPIRMTTGGGSNMRASYLAAALSQNLDTLSLQAEAVRAMLQVDPERARDLFEQMRPLHLAPLTCTDTLIYSPSEYYRTAGVIYNRAFNPEEQAKGLPADFLESIFREVSHATEAAPAIGQLYEFHLDPDQQTRMEGALIRAVGNIRGDSRSFSATQSSFVFYVTRIARSAGRSHRALLEGARNYLVANASGPQCQSGNAALQINIAADLYPDLNRIFQAYDIKPITADEVKPSSIISSEQNQPPPYWSSSATKQLQSDSSSLRSGADATDKTSLQWQSHAEAFLNELSGWTDPSSEPSPDDFYIEKALLYAGLISIAPVDSNAYNDALSAYISFLGNQPASDNVRIFQLWSIRQLVQRGRRDRNSAAQGRKNMEAATHTAPNPSIALYGYLLSLEDTQHAER